MLNKLWILDRVVSDFFVFGMFCDFFKLMIFCDLGQGFAYRQNWGQRQQNQDQQKQDEHGGGGGGRGRRQDYGKCFEAFFAKNFMVAEVIWLKVYSRR